jgi:hypothetical protein
MGFAILGIMHHDRVEGRPVARACLKCMDTCPCGRKGEWWDGLVTCSHGYVYDIDYTWEGPRAKLQFLLQKRKWWSYLIISNAKHEKTVNNAI